MNVLEFIPIGKENALSARELADLLHCPRRVVTRTIEKARRKGAPICAANAAGSAKGFYVAADRAELAEYLHRLNSRIVEIQANRDGLQAALNNWGADADG